MIRSSNKDGIKHGHLISEHVLGTDYHMDINHTHMRINEHTLDTKCFRVVLSWKVKESPTTSF